MHDERHRDARDREVAALIAAGRDREAARRGAGLVDTNPTKGATMNALDQFQQLGPVLGSVIAGIRPEQLDQPTRSTDFTVRGVLEHMIGGATYFAAAYRGEEPSTATTDADPIAGIQRALSDLAGAVTAPGALERTIESPFGSMSGETFARYIVLDGLVHGWDMASATGQPYEPPQALVDAANEFATSRLDAWRDGQAFGPAVEPAASASPIERLVAYTGRADRRA